MATRPADLQQLSAFCLVRAVKFRCVFVTDTSNRKPYTDNSLTLADRRHRTAFTITVIHALARQKLPIRRRHKHKTCITQPRLHVSYALCLSLTLLRHPSCSLQSHRELLVCIQRKVLHTLSTSANPSQSLCRLECVYLCSWSTSGPQRTPVYAVVVQLCTRIRVGLAFKCCFVS